MFFIPEKERLIYHRLEISLSHDAHSRLEDVATSVSMDVPSVIQQFLEWAIDQKMIKSKNKSRPSKQPNNSTFSES